MKLKRTILVPELLILAALSLQACSVMGYFTDQKAVPLEPYAGVPSRTPIYEHGEWIIARASMHNHTIYSDGSRTPEDLCEMARREGMAILAYTDHREGDICVGKSLCLPANGVEKYGYAAYLDHIARIEESSDDIIILEGVEVMPWFYQYGRGPSYVLMNQNFHFTVYRVWDPETLWNMPARRSVPDLKPEPDPGIGPYQDFVDYIVEHGGIVHAVHVESYQDRWVAGGIHVISRQRPEHVSDLDNLTGFSILPEGYAIAGAVGGNWDAALSEYLIGGRDTVPWAMGDADYHGPRGSLARSTTLFYMREFTEDEVYECLRDGRMVALMGPAFQDAYVSELCATEARQVCRQVTLGESVTVSGAPRIRFALDREIPGVTAMLVRNGRVVYETRSSAFDFTDVEMGEKNLPAFYRVVAVKDGAGGESDSILFTNPLFVYHRP